MDLIYTDSTNKELGILQSYQLDIAFGSDENNFALKLALDDDILEIGSRIYIEGTEYGGIVDSVQVDTSTNEITYKGRTWHGILANKVIEPPAKQNYLVLSGDANNVIQQLINRTDVSDVFYTLGTNSGFAIKNYEFRYTNLYDGIRAMLMDVNARLEIYRIGKLVCLNAVPLIDYSTNEEWDISQKSFTAESVGRKINHLICLGQGDLKDRACIHLFASGNGEIQPYTNKDEEEIYSDSDYILTKQNQVLFGKDELVEVYDYPSAEITENYVLTEKLYNSKAPSDWGRKYTKYFVKDGDDFKNVEVTYEDELYPENGYQTQPRKWSTKYSNYYTADGKAVEGVVVDEYYENLPKQKTPAVNDWAKNYSKYYYWKTDGITGEWTQVSGVDVKRYRVQKEIPSDWSTNWKNYFIYWHQMEQCKKIKYKDNNGNIVEKIPDFEKGLIFKKTDDGNYTEVTKKPDKWQEVFSQYYKATKTTYVKVSDKYASMPKWKTATFYSYVTIRKKAPEWDELVQYAIKHPETVVAPTFTAGTYYIYKSTLKKPIWTANKYYEKKIDRLAELVKSGIETLTEYQNSDSLSMTLPDDKYEYFVGDKVGATAEAQGFSIIPQAITKKIVVIDNTGINISYEIGGGN